MLLSLKWLENYTKVPQDLQAFCDRLDLTGTGVEGVEKLGAELANIVTAKVLEKEKHPDSDHMWVCKVDVGQFNLGEDGNPEPLQIVCGAQNFNVGDHIVTALIGATLPGDVKIKKSKLRGVVSYGMNCSERELGLGSDHDGIMILPEDAPVGVPFVDYMQISDTVLDLEITPNRPDCLSVEGLAREVGAILFQDVHYPLKEDVAKLDKVAKSERSIDDVSIAIADPDRCARYDARVIDNVKIGPSPKWLAERVIASGSRSINNVVDATNYIMYLYGQPLHAFDYDSIKGADGKVSIIVRPAEDGERFTTLDSVDRILNEDMTVIATPERAIALAGVMGGLDSEVEEDTTTILLETATFSRSHTSRTSRSLGLISEASLRYERGVDPVPIEEISKASAALIAEVSGGSVREGSVDVYPVVPSTKVLRFRVLRFNFMMGTDISEDFVIDTLKSLGCETIRSLDDGILQVTVPSFRPDLEREIDLYEEVIRIWGMDRVPSTLPASPKRVGTRTQEEIVRAMVNETLTASGISETMTYSFAPTDDMEKLGIEASEVDLPVELLNPMNSEHSIMRQSIIPGLLRAVSSNQDHGVNNIQLYEIGKVFSTQEGRKQPRERVKVAAVLAGSMRDQGWNSPSAPFDFFDGKGVIENLIDKLSMKKVTFKALDANEAKHLQPGRAANVLANGNSIGWIGEIHPKALERFDAKGPVVAFELDFDKLAGAYNLQKDYVDIPQYPAIEIDQAFIVGKDVTNEDMIRAIKSAGGKLLESVELFDMYEDDQKVGKDKKSLTYRMTYRAPDRTLTSEKVESAHGHMVQNVIKKTGSQVRS